MSETPPPYTGKPAPAAEAAPAPMPAMPVPFVPTLAIWHSRALLIGVGVLAALVGIATAVGGVNFPSAAPVESAFAFGILVDMIAVVVTIAIMTVVEYRRRADPVRQGLPVDTRRSVFAIVAVGLAVLTLVVWIVGDGPRQVIDLAQGLRARYMYHTAGLFFAGIPWVLSLVFGAWGFRPKANAMTNGLAIAAVAVSGLLAVVAAVAALVYGAGLSD